MEYSDSYLRKVLPGEDPASEFVPYDVAREIKRRLEREKFEDPELLARSVRWTYAIFSELGLGNFRLASGFSPFDIMGFIQPLVREQIIVGLYDRDKEGSGFGLSLNVPAWSGSPFLIWTEVHFPRLRQSFPFAIRTVSTELHAAPNPVNATSTCWARCNDTHAWGIVTAGHAVGTNQAGVPVPLDNGTHGISYRYEPIDAAFVLTVAPDTMPSPLPMSHFPAAGLPVTVECKRGSQRRTIVSACNTLDFYRTRVFPVLFFIDQPCVPGDSGALVRLTTGEASGIYCGAQPSPQNGGTSGRVLNFEQAMFALNTTAFL